MADDVVGPSGVMLGEKPEPKSATPLDVLFAIASLACMEHTKNSAGFVDLPLARVEEAMQTYQCGYAVMPCPVTGTQVVRFSWRAPAAIASRPTLLGPNGRPIA